MFTKADPRINYGGRPKKSPMVKQLEEMCRDEAEASIDAIREIRDDPGNPPAVRLAAAQAMLDRGFGKPIDRQAVLNMSPGGGQDEGETLSLAQLMRIAAQGQATGTGGRGQVIDLRALPGGREGEGTPPSDLKPGA